MHIYFSKYCSIFLAYICVYFCACAQAHVYAGVWICIHLHMSVQMLCGGQRTTLGITPQALSTRFLFLFSNIVSLY